MISLLLICSIVEISATIQINETLVIAAEEWSPYIRLERDSNDTLAIAGPMRRILDVLSEKMNFQYTLVQPPDHYWGVPDENGTYNGMLGQIQRKEVDMALGPFMMIHSRTAVTSFSTALWIDNLHIIVGRPRRTYDFFNFIKPFGFWVQITLLVFVGIVSLIFKIITAVQNKINENRAPRLTFTETFLWTLRMLAQEASHTIRVTRALKIMFATWLLGSFILMKSYEGILTAMLTLPKVVIPIDSLKDLAEQTEISWKLESASMFYQYLRESSNPVAQIIFKGTNGTISSCYAAREELARREFASMCDVISIRKIFHWDFSNHGICNLYKTREPVLGNVQLSIAFPHNSTLQASVDYWIHMMHHTGLLEKWMADELTNATQCLVSPSSDGRSSESLVLELNAFYGCFFILAAGSIISSIAFIGELMMKATKDLRHKNA